MVECPKCGQDISDTFEGADPSTGIMCGSWFCDPCNVTVGEHEVEREGHPDDVLLSFAPEPGQPIGTPFSELAGRPGDTPEQAIRYENFKRIARSWGYD